MSTRIYGEPRTRTRVNTTHDVISDAMASDVEVPVELSETIATIKFFRHEGIYKLDKWHGINIDDYVGSICLTANRR